MNNDYRAEQEEILEMLGRAVDCEAGEAFALYCRCAELGDAEGQYLCGTMLIDGEGCDCDEARGVEMVCRALAQGYGPARWLARGWIDDGVLAEERMETVFRAFVRAAELGNAEAMATVGMMYDRGLGVARDPEAAGKWDKFAARAGNAEAMCRIGLRALEEKDYDTALAWLGSADHAGCAEASETLGDMYRRGDGVQPDADRAVHYYGRAAERGCDDCERKRADVQFESGDYAPAMAYYDSLMTVDSEVSYRIGWMYEQGRGAVRSADKAMDNYAVASLFGHVEATAALGRLYYAYSRDARMAEKYLTQAAAAGHEGAQKFLKEHTKNGRFC